MEKGKRVIQGLERLQIEFGTEVVKNSAKKRKPSFNIKVGDVRQSLKNGFETETVVEHFDHMLLLEIKTGTEHGRAIRYNLGQAHLPTPDSKTYAIHTNASEIGQELPAKEQLYMHKRLRTLAEMQVIFDKWVVDSIRISYQKEYKRLRDLETQKRLKQKDEFAAKVYSEYLKERDNLDALLTDFSMISSVSRDKKVMQSAAQVSALFTVVKGMQRVRVR